MTAATKRWLMIALLVAVLFGLTLGGAAGMAAAADGAGQRPAVVSVEQRTGDPTQADWMVAMLREVHAALQASRTQGAGVAAVGRTRAGDRPDLVRFTGAMPWSPTVLFR